MFSHISSRKKKRYLLLTLCELVLGVLGIAPLFYFILNMTTTSEVITVKMIILLSVYELILIIIGIPIWYERWKITQKIQED